MSPGAIYLRDQAAKCRAHAASMSDAQTQAALRKLADEYIAQAEQIESGRGDGERTGQPQRGRNSARRSSFATAK